MAGGTINDLAKSFMNGEYSHLSEEYVSTMMQEGDPFAAAEMAMRHMSDNAEYSIHEIERIRDKLFEFEEFPEVNRVLLSLDNVVGDYYKIHSDGSQWEQKSRPAAKKVPKILILMISACCLAVGLWFMLRSGISNSESSYYDSVLTEKRENAFISDSKDIIKNYALNNQNYNFTELMGSDAPVKSSGFNADIKSIEPVVGYLVVPKNGDTSDFKNKYFLIFKVTGSDYMHEQLISYVTIRFTDIDSEGKPANYDYYLAPYGEKRITDAYDQHIKPYESDYSISKKEFIDIKEELSGDETITISVLDQRLEEYRGYGERLIKEYALNNQNYNFAGLMLSDADVIREGFNANISSISHVASYLVIPENPESTGFDNKLYMIFKVTGSDYMNDNLISFVTIRLTNVRESSHIESLDYYLIPYGKTSVGSSYAEHIEPYEKECYIESKEYTQ